MELRRVPAAVCGMASLAPMRCENQVVILTGINAGCELFGILQKAVMMRMRVSDK